MHKASANRVGKWKEDYHERARDEQGRRSRRVQGRADTAKGGKPETNQSVEGKRGKERRGKCIKTGTKSQMAQEGMLAYAP